MNNEVEAYVGELRQLREREVKLGRIVGLVESLMERRLSDSADLTEEDCAALDALQRSVEMPEIQNWVDGLRKTGKVDVKRYPTTFASRQSGNMKAEDAEEANVA